MFGRTVLGAIRSSIPFRWRAGLRRSTAFNAVMRFCFGGLHGVKHPKAPYTLYFEGSRNLGWATGGLPTTESAEMDFALATLAGRDAKCAWDIGANIGLWTLLLAGIKPPLQQIICFEPDETNRRILQANLTRNNITIAQVRAQALSSRHGAGEFNVDLVTGSTGTLEQGGSFVEEWYGRKTDRVAIELETVDRLVEAGTTVPDFIKIDVEGHELSVLEGARQTLQKYHPILMMEVTAHAEEIGKLLSDLGYHLIDPATGGRIMKPAFATAALPGNAQQ
jgi:FkbM family methyltransferase